MKWTISEDLPGYTEEELHRLFYKVRVLEHLTIEYLCICFKVNNVFIVQFFIRIVTFTLALAVKTGISNEVGRCVGGKTVDSHRHFSVSASCPRRGRNF